MRSPPDWARAGAADDPTSPMPASMPMSNSRVFMRDWPSYAGRTRNRLRGAGRSIEDERAAQARGLDRDLEPGLPESVQALPVDPAGPRPPIPGRGSPALE